MVKRENILNSALKALLAGVETSAAVKIPATFISELASLPKDQRETLGKTPSIEEFETLLMQAELATINAALATVGTDQIKKMVSKLNTLSDDKINYLTALTQNEFDEIVGKLDAIYTITRKTEKTVDEIAENMVKDKKSNIKKVIIIIDNYDILDFNTTHKQLLCNGLAVFLNVAPSDVKIIDVEAGSVRVTVEIPEERVEEIVQAVKESDPKLMEIVKPLYIAGIEKKSNQVRVHYEVERNIQSYLSNISKEKSEAMPKGFNIFDIPITLVTPETVEIEFKHINTISQIQKRKIRKILIHGKPACGKTISAKRIFIESKNQIRLIPIELLEEDFNEVDKVRNTTMYKLSLTSIDTFTHLEKEGRFLFLYDGLNESSNIINSAKTFYRLSNTLWHSTFLITCRSHEYQTKAISHLKGFHPYMIRDLNWDDIEYLINKKITEKSKKEEILKAFEDPDLQATCTNQFICLMVLDLFREKDFVPKTIKSEVYESFLDTFLKRWAKKPVHLEEQRSFLEDIAYYITCSQDSKTLILEENLLKDIKEEKGLDGTKILNELYTNGFLEKKGDRIKIFQQTFQDFLLASYMTKHNVFPINLETNQKNRLVEYMKLETGKMVEISEKTEEFYLELSGIQSLIDKIIDKQKR
jgi:hypothetical protein